MLLPEHAAPPGHAAPPAHDAAPPPGMLLFLGMMLSHPPSHQVMGMLQRQKNRNRSVASMDHYFVTEGISFWVVFLHLALNFVTILKKYF
jgi:hypothetical protein